MKKLLIILMSLVYISCTKPSIQEQATPIKVYSIIGYWQNGNLSQNSITWLDIDSFNIESKVLNKGSVDTIKVKVTYVRINSDSIETLLIRSLDDTTIYARKRVYCKNKNDSVLYYGSKDGIFKKL
jgi:hypothetical protein